MQCITNNHWSLQKTFGSAVCKIMESCINLSVMASRISALSHRHFIPMSPVGGIYNRTQQNKSITILSADCRLCASIQTAMHQVGICLIQ